MAEERLTRRYLVSGMVQGVGFRYFVRRVAARLGLAGWVRNLEDGRVEALADGPVELLARFEGELRRGPSMAQIAGVEVFEISEESGTSSGFEIRG